MALIKATNRMISGASVNVLDFGAKGDGTTDDGPAIQLAINSLPSGGTVVIPKGEFLISTGVFITKGIRMLGAGRANFNGYTSSFSPTVFSGATLIRVSNGVTAFSFNKGTNVTAFGCSIEEMSFASAVISQAAYGAPPVFPANTHAINMNETAELVLDRLDFMNLDKCIFNTTGILAVKPFMENLTAKDCNYFIKAEDAAADYTVSNISLIKMNYGIHTTSLDGLVLNNAIIYRSYVSAMYDVGGGSNQISNFINISNSHFFESGSTLCYFHSISQLTITGCDFVRAGLVKRTASTPNPQTGLLIHNSETVSVSGGMIERSLGDGAQVYGNRYVDFATNIMFSGYLSGSRTGLIAYDNESINVDCNITCVGVVAVAAANFSNSKSVSGVITSDDIVIGRTETLVQRGVTEYVQCLTFPSVIGQGGNVNLAIDIPYYLNSASTASGQSLVLYEVEYPTGGSGTGVEGLVFRVNSNPGGVATADFSTVFNNTGKMNFRKVLDTNTSGSGVGRTFSIYLHNLVSAGLGNFNIAPGNIIKFKYKIVEYAIDTY